jgi:DNA-binding transcriptional LysR family regulator
MTKRKVSLSPLLSALSWDDLRIVKAIGEHGGLAAAAAMLGLNHSTISRRLSVVEGSLGVVLFDRRRSGYTATAAGAEIIALGERVEEDVLSVTRRVSGPMRGHKGNLRVATSDALLYDFLNPIIGDFQRNNPEVRVEVLVGNAVKNLARGDSDIAFRAATLAPPENLYGRKAARIAWAIYGRKIDYLGTQPLMEELYQSRWVSYGDTLTGLRAFDFVERRVPENNVCYRADSVLGVASAVCAGLGIAFLPCMHADLVPSLTRIGAIEPEVYDELWILTHPDIRKSGRVYAFMSHCSAAIAKRRRFIEGRGGSGSFNPAAMRLNRPTS